MGRTETQAWQGKVLLRLGVAAFVGRAGDNRLHRHYAVQIVISSDAFAQLQSDAGVVATAKVLGCPANVAHRLVPSRRPVAIIYLEPTTTFGRIAQQQIRARSINGSGDAARLFTRIEAAVEDDSGEGVLAVLRDVLQVAGPRPVHPADPRVLRIMESAAFPSLPPSLAEAAALASLSPSRFSHLFAGEMDIAYRAFLKWRKLMLALLSIAKGADLTRAAHDAGFADSAHFSRTFVSMFGLPPRQALAGLRFPIGSH